jgi:hypothetical protein
LHGGLLFVAATAGLVADEIGSGQPGGVEEPAGEDGSRAQLFRLAGQDDEYRLRDFLRLGGVGHLAQGDRMHEAEVARNERRERLLGPAPGVFAKQLHVIHIRHFV